jgi:hypothetical protein
VRTFLASFHAQSSLLLSRGLAEPVFESGLGEDRVIAGNEGALLQFCAEVARVRIRDHFAWIVVFPEASPDQFVETERLWPRYFNDAVHWRDPTEILPTALATSSAAIGWIRTGASRTVLPSVAVVVDVIVIVAPFGLRGDAGTGAPLRLRRPLRRRGDARHP